MSTNVMAILSMFFFLCATMSHAQPYELEWDNLNQSTVKAAESYTLNWEEVDQHVPTARAKVLAEPQAEPQESNLVAVYPGQFSPPEGSVAPQTNPWKQSSQSERKINLTFSGRQFFDYYAERYKVVERIEISVFRKSGGTYYQTYWNTGQHQNYVIYENGLALGDRYRAVVIWDDGSNRTLDQTLNSSSYTTVVVDQPDHLAYSYD